MNNRYICRGKRKDNGEWIYGNFCRGNERQSLHDSIFVYDCETQSFDNYDIIPETVGQCTERKDKNGKWMFEGDVVNALFDFGMPIKAVCIFKDGSFGLLAKQHGVEHFHAFTSICNVKYEVIGNIHDDNPELLEEER